MTGQFMGRHLFFQPIGAVILRPRPLHCLFKRFLPFLPGFNPRSVMLLADLDGVAQSLLNESLRHFPAREVERLAHRRAIQRSLNPDRARAGLVAAGLVFCSFRGACDTARA